MTHYLHTTLSSGIYLPVSRIVYFQKESKMNQNVYIKLILAEPNYYITLRMSESCKKKCISIDLHELTVKQQMV